jgi:polysaccharide biosynthesis protein PslG
MRSMVQWFGAAFCILAITAAAAWAADPALPYGINAHLPSSALLDRVAAAGIAWIRVDFNWFMMEPARGVYDWAITDAVVRDARARGLNVYATLAYAPAWANGNQAPNTPPVDAQDWYAFVSTTVSRYRGSVRHWGMWNEPNFKSFFSGSPDQYINTILRVGAQAVRDADPSGSVLGPELAQEGDWWVWLYTVLEQAAEAIDIVTQHSYQDSGQDVLRRVGGPVEPWNWPTVRDVMQWTGTDAKALWLTEIGWNTAGVSEAEQAAYYTQVLDGVEAYGWLDKVFFYQLIDEPGTPDQWGVLRADLSPKPAYETYQRHITLHASTPLPGWSAVVSVPGWFGDDTQGADMTMADLNGNGRPDLVVFHIDAPAGDNAGYYHIGWDLDAAGKARQWSDEIPSRAWRSASALSVGSGSSRTWV